MLYYAKGSAENVLTNEDIRNALNQVFDKIGPRKKVLAIPPDITRYHSRAGDLTRILYDRFGSALTDVLPALGTHAPMTDTEIARMFPGVPRNLFREHRWRTDLTTLGTVPGSFMAKVSEGKLDYDWPAQVNTLLAKGGHDLIFSPGQVVPHEVIGMANHTKNVFIGTGGSEGIHKSHFLGAVHGMERIMGRADSPRSCRSRLCGPGICGKTADSLRTDGAGPGYGRSAGDAGAVYRRRPRVF